MDLSSLAELGKIAGVAGIAIGMIVLITRPMIEGAKDLPRAERARRFASSQLAPLRSGDWASSPG